MGVSEPSQPRSITMTQILLKSKTGSSFTPLPFPPLHIIHLIKFILTRETHAPSSHLPPPSLPLSAPHDVWVSHFVHTVHYSSSSTKLLIIRSVFTVEQTAQGKWDM